MIGQTISHYRITAKLGVEGWVPATRRKKSNYSPLLGQEIERRI